MTNHYYVLCYTTCYNYCTNTKGIGASGLAGRGAGAARESFLRFGEIGVDG